MDETLACALWFLCVYSLGYVEPVDSSHFMGGLVHWRPVNPAAFDGTVQITHRIAWRRDSSEGGTCTQATIDAQTTLLGDISAYQLTCQSGCSGDIGNFSYYCTDFSATDEWSTGERAYTYNFTESSFEAVFSGCCWISLVIGSPGWELRVRGTLTYREDTGLINSSPVVNMPPLIRLQHGCSHTIKIPVEDADGDHVRCRWAESFLGECSGVCRSFPANLNKITCELEYQATGQTGRYVVALQVEDFASATDITPLSSIPVQFVIDVFMPTSNNQSCTSRPTLVGTTPQDGSHIGVPCSSSWSTVITAQLPNNSPASSITDIITASPLGMRKSAVVPSLSNPREWTATVMWTPSLSQTGPNIFCYSALDNTGITSIQRCITLLGEVMPPTLVPGSMSPSGEIFSNNTIWSIQINEQFTRPSSDSFIRIFEKGGEEVFSINVATSSAVIYPNDTTGRTLTFNISYLFPENRMFYILLDPGVAVGTEFCNSESPALRDPTLWIFMTADETPPKIQLKAPVMSNEGIAVSWVFNEEAFSTCELHFPATLNVSTVPCFNNTVMLTYAEEGYSLFIQGIDVEGNEAEPVRLTWSIVTVSCGNINLTDVVLELHTPDDSTSTSLIYHCAESISANQTITSVCSSDGDSRWNPDPASHGCASISTDTAAKKDYGDIIIIVSTVLAFILGIFCGLLPCHCIHMLLKRKAKLRQESANLQVKQIEELVTNDLYEEVTTAARYRLPDTCTSVEVTPNIAYGQY